VECVFPRSFIKEDVKIEIEKAQDKPKIAAKDADIRLKRKETQVRFPAVTCYVKDKENNLEKVIIREISVIGNQKISVIDYQEDPKVPNSNIIKMMPDLT